MDKMMDLIFKTNGGSTSTLEKDLIYSGQGYVDFQQGIMVEVVFMEV